jgi:cation/acetate symporter
MSHSPAYAAYKRRLHRILAMYVVGLVAFLLLMAWAEQRGMSRVWLGPIFLFSTVMIYAGIGIYGRTTDADEYYVAGRRIPPMYNGMAAAADWMSAASFISLAGGLYLQGFSGTEVAARRAGLCAGLDGGLLPGGVAGGAAPAQAQAVHRSRLLRAAFWRPLAAADRRVLAAVLCSFTYVVAQIYGVGLIASRLTGVQFEIGILLGLGGVLLCSFLGGCVPSPGRRWRSTSSCCWPF